jgi:hypothetical protein
MIIQREGIPSSIENFSPAEAGLVSSLCGINVSREIFEGASSGGAIVHPTLCLHRRSQTSKVSCAK